MAVLVTIAPEAPGKNCRLSMAKNHGGALPAASTRSRLLLGIRFLPRAVSNVKRLARTVTPPVAAVAAGVRVNVIITVSPG